MSKPLKGITCDSAYSSKNKLLQYQGHNIETGELLFHSKLYSETLWLNNIGEYFAIVKSIWYVINYQLDLDIYSDSEVAINWINNKKVSTKIENNNILKLVKAAEDYVKFIDLYVGLPEIVKWNTAQYGDILSDFGNKSKKKI